MISRQLRKSFFYLIPKIRAEYHVSSLPQLHCFFSASTRPNFAAPAVSEPKTTENSASVTHFLKENGFSDTQLKFVMNQRQQLHFANLEKSIKPKINELQKFGFSNSEIAEIITTTPAILCSSLNNKVHPSLSMLHNLFNSHDKILKLLRKARWFLITDLNKTVYPNIEFLEGRGLSMQRIILLLNSCPTSILLTPSVLKKNVEKLEALGLNPSSGIFIYALWAVVSISDKVWDLKLQTFMELGFTESEALDIFRKAPMVFAASSDKIKRNAEVILATGKYTKESLFLYPLSLTYSYENRLKPRFNVLEMLENRKVIEKWPRLGIVYSYTDKRFNEIYVYPYLNEVGEIYDA